MDASNFLRLCFETTQLVNLSKDGSGSSRALSFFRGGITQLLTHLVKEEHTPKFPQGGGGMNLL